MIPLPVSTFALVTWSAAAARARCVTFCFGACFWALLNGSVAPRDGPVAHGRWTAVTAAARPAVRTALLEGSTSLAAGGYEPGGRPVLAHTRGGGHTEARDRRG